MMKVKYADLRPGDVFGFHIGDGIYAFARLLFMVEGTAHICEVFDYKGGALVFGDDIVLSPRLMPLQDINLYSTIKPSVWKWRLIHRSPAFLVPLEEIRDLEFAYGRVQAIRYNVDWHPGSQDMRRISRAITPEESEKLETITDTLNTERLYIRIRRLWKLHPYEWESKAEMWTWFIENKVLFKRASH
jgi:hypothetical protein